MDKQWFELFSDRNHWNNLVETYINTDTAPGKVPNSHIPDLWEYFKFCLLTDNRFFFEHPLLNVIKNKINDHVITLPINTTLFRARIDFKNSIQDQARNLNYVKSLYETKDKAQSTEKDGFDELIARFESMGNYENYSKQYQKGFEGFSAENCMAPPSYIVTHGRCNLPNLSHLYVAEDIHTAVAETRPYIHDSISVASIRTLKELRIIDFSYSLADQNIFKDWFYLSISSEFSATNKGNENDYFATQYLTMLVKSLGYDGLKFKSSLVFDGVNYVIFDDTSCKPISSKLYTVGQVQYGIFPVLKDTHLKDAVGTEISNPPIIKS